MKLFLPCVRIIDNDVKDFVFGSVKVPVYGFGRKRKFVMSFTMKVRDFHSMDGHAAR